MPPAARSRTPLALPLVLLLLSVTCPAAAQRLPDSVAPEHYTLWFAPDFTSDTFRGTDAIRVRIKRQTRSITLHAADIEFGTVKITARGRTQTARVTLDSKSETATLTVADPLPAGPATIDISFAGTLNDKLRGFYLSTANGRKYAVTQLEATDARRAFPCFDEPGFKATFDISLTVDQRDTAISNGRLLSDTPDPAAGTHTVTFARTPRMSVYLVAMLVGDFACREGAVGETPVRVCSTPDKKALTGFALEAAQRVLAFYNDYFGIRYPFGKLDIIGIPDFAAGAMENAGAITFRESTLLTDPERASLRVRKTVASVLAHEIAHQWFGDLVTMKWWNDIWLNEGFATWLANKPLEEWKPEWNVQLDDVEDNRKALSTDALRTTRAIRTTVDTPDQINEVFDAIAYEKTAAVLRMVEHYTGKESFRRAVSSYLRKFSFSNAAGEDFWNEVTRVTGKPVNRIMASFVTQPGAPVLTIRSSCVGTSTELRLKQERFVGVANTPAPPAQTWTLPVCAKSSAQGGATCKVISKSEETIVVPGCTGPVFVNADSLGYFFSEYTTETVREFAGKGRGGLSAAERLSLLGDEWSMVRAGRHEIGAYLDIAGALSNDESAPVIGEIASRLRYAAAYLVKAPGLATYQAWIRATFGPVLDGLGMPGPASDTDARQSRRATLISLVGLTANSPDVQRRAGELALMYFANPSSIPGTLAPTILRVAAVRGDAVLYDQYRARLTELGSNPEEFYRYFGALTYFSDPALTTRTLEFALSSEVRSQDTATLIAGLMGGSGRERVWAFVKTNWETITSKLGTFQSLPAVVGGLGGFCSTEAAAEIARFFAEHPVPSAERTLRQALEQVASCAALNARQSPALAAWLQASHPAP